MYGSPIRVNFFQNQTLNELFPYAIPIQSIYGIPGSLFLALSYDNNQTIITSIITYVPQFNGFCQAFLRYKLEQKIEFLNASMQEMTQLFQVLHLTENDNLFSAAYKLRQTFPVRINIIQSEFSEERGIVMNSGSNSPEIFLFSNANKEAFVLLPKKLTIPFTYDMFKKEIKPYMVGFVCGHEFLKVQVAGAQQCPSCFQQLFAQEMFFYGECTLHNQLGIRLSCGCINCFTCFEITLNTQNYFCMCGKEFDSASISIIASGSSTESLTNCSSCKKQQVENAFYKVRHSRCGALCHLCVLAEINNGALCEICKQDYVRL